MTQSLFEVHVIIIHIDYIFHKGSIIWLLVSIVGHGTIQLLRANCPLQFAYIKIFPADMMETKRGDYHGGKRVRQVERE